jgi:RNA polymerase sigma-70 factor (ECF subfamily)
MTVRQPEQGVKRKKNGLSGPLATRQQRIEATLERADERALLDRLAQGERSAADTLVERTYRAVFASLIRLTGGNRDLAADLTQETYRRAWQSLPGFDRRARLGTWLYRIAYNAFLNHLRRPGRVVPLEGEHPVEVPDPSPGQDDSLSHREVAARLRRAVIGLPEELRFTVTARFWAELPVADIAHHEHVTGAAIRKRLIRAMTLLRANLEEDAA